MFLKTLITPFDNVETYLKKNYVKNIKRIPLSTKISFYFFT